MQPSQGAVAVANSATRCRARPHRCYRKRGWAHPWSVQLLAGVFALALNLYARQGIAQEQGNPTIDVVQVVLVEPGTDAPLSVQVKASGALPAQSFIRIKGLPPTASLSEGYFVRPGVWAVPLSSLSSVRITVPAAQAGRSQLTISLVGVDNTVLAEATTTLVVGAASLFPAKPAAPAPAAPKSAKGEVTLRMKGGAFELRGQLKAYEGGRYIINNKVFGTMTLDAANMECIGVGCPATAAVSPPATGGAAALSKVVGIHGSDAIGWDLMPALIRAYAERLGGTTNTLAGANPLEERYKLLDANGREAAVFDLKRYGTPTAFAGLEEGSAQIGMASRPINDEEAARLIRAGTPNIRSPQYEHVLGLDGLVVIVAQDNPAVSLSIDDIAKIFSGQITDWQQVGLPPGGINVYSANRKSGAYATFDELVLQPRRLAPTPSAHFHLSTAEVSDAVAADLNGIGITSFAYVRSAKALNVESSCGLITRPSVFTVKTEEYPLTRRLYLYTVAKPAHRHVKGFLEFALSKEAQRVIADKQFVDQTPVSLGFDDQGGRIAYALNASKEDFNIAQMRELIADINGARRLSITFRFRSAAFDLDTKARADIDRLAALAATPELRGKRLLLLGFADSAGPYAANATLALRRATAVRDTLVAAAKGTLDPSLVVHKGYSELAPVACNDQVEGRNLNRRVEVWVRD
ncbi:MAG: phosphate ABC transporter substrate-binding/OmpA family protein [Hyphomicrobiaceae bacterium]|nr:phosphate ABC transporter substrate-binding/OmpA family protein [Hyphomicrobiaceae bacterium]